VTKTLDFSLQDRVAIITGGAGLLGVQHAEAIAAAGGIPVLADIRREEAESRAAEVAKSTGGKALALECDVTQTESIQALLDVVRARLGRVDILVNNADHNPKVETPGRSFSRLENFPAPQWDSDLDVGLKGPFLCSKIIGSAFAAQKRGVIINISSEYGIIAPDQRLYRKPGLPAEEQPVKPVSYSVVKAGLHGLTLYLATYWAQEGVRANTLSLGGVEQGQPAMCLDLAEAQIALGRMARERDL